MAATKKRAGKGRPAERSEDEVVNVRVPREWLGRADELVAVLEGREDVRAFARPSRSMVLRLAVLRGIEVLEKEYAQRK